MTIRKNSAISHHSIISDRYFEMSLLEEDIFDKSNKSNQNDPFADHHIDNFISCIYMLMGVFLFSFVNLGGKFITEFFSEIEMSTVCFFRGLLPIILGLIYAKKYKIDIISEWKIDNRKTFLLFLRCFFGASCNYGLFEALKYMRISSAFTLYNTAPIFTSILSIYLFKSKFTKFDFFSLLICFFSVCLISKPGFLSFLFHTNTAGEDSALGVLIVLGSAVISSCGILLNKYVARDFHYIQSTILYGVFFIFDSLILVILDHVVKGDFYIFQNFFELKFNSFIICVLIGIINFLNTNVYIHSLNIGDPIVVLPLTYLGIVVNMIYNTFIFGKSTDIWDIIGSLMIIAVNLKRIFDQRKK